MIENKKNLKENN